MLNAKMLIRIFWIISWVFDIRHSVRMRLGFCPAEPRNWKWPNGVGNSEMSIIWCIYITNNVKTCKKFNERAQTAKFSVLCRLRQELFAENPKNKENKRNLNANYSKFPNTITYPGLHHVEEHAQGFPKMWYFSIFEGFIPELLGFKVGSNINKKIQRMGASQKTNTFELGICALQNE